MVGPAACTQTGVSGEEELVWGGQEELTPGTPAFLE